MEAPKQRPLVLEEYIVAYFGDYLTMLEKGIEHLVDIEIKNSNIKSHQPSKITNTLNHQPSKMSDGN